MHGQSLVTQRLMQTSPRVLDNMQASYTAAEWLVAGEA